MAYEKCKGHPCGDTEGGCVLVCGECLSENERLAKEAERARLESLLASEREALNEILSCIQSCLGTAAVPTKLTEGIFRIANQRDDARALLASERRARESDNALSEQTTVQLLNQRDAALARLEEAQKDAAVVSELLELGDARLVAADGPCGGQNAATALSAEESARLYEACQRIAAKGAK